MSSESAFDRATAPRRRPLVRAAAGGLLLASFSFAARAGSLTPPGPPAPTGRTLFECEPRRALVGPGPFVIDAPGSYYLTQDVVVAGVSGIVITSPDVTLDLAGFSIWGDLTTVGLAVMDGAARVAVRNGRISGFADGLYFLAGATSGEVSGVAFDDFTSRCVVVDRGEATFTDCSCDRVGSLGFQVSAGSRGSFVGCVVRSGPNWGAIVNSGGHGEFRNCVVRGAGTGYSFWHFDGGFPAPTGLILDSVASACGMGIQVADDNGPCFGVAVARNHATNNATNYVLTSALAAPVVPASIGPCGWCNVE